jgi:hypothetical protein
MKLRGTRKRPDSASRRRHRTVRFEQLERRHVLTALTPTPPLVLAGLVGPDLVITCSSPEADISVIENSGTIAVIGNSQNYYGSDGNLDQLQTDINNSGATAATFAPGPLRDLKIKLAGVDSWLQVGDPDDPVIVGRDLIISMPASTTFVQLADDGISTTTHLDLAVDSVTVGRNMTIAVGTLTTSEAAVIDVTDTTLGPKGNLSITTAGSVPNMIGVGASVVNGNASVTTGAGDDLIAVVGATVAGRLAVSAGAGNNTVLATDDFNETVDSSLQTFVATHETFGDGLDGGLTDLGVQGLADDLEAASSAGFSLDAQNVNVYVLDGDNVVDVYDAALSGGNLVIGAGDGTNVIALTATLVDDSSVGSPLGNATITAGNGDNLIAIAGLDVSGGLSVSAGAGNDVVLATPDVATVVDAAIADFVADNPSAFYDPTDAGAPANGILDIDGLTQEITDISASDGFAAYKAAITTKDLAANASTIDISQSDVAATLAVTMGSGADGLFVSEVGVGTISGTGPTGGTATLKTGNGSDTIVIVGVGTLAAGSVSGSAPTGQMNSFTLTTGSGPDSVVISLDWEGDPGYAAGPACGIDAAMQGYVGTNPAIQDTVQAVDEELDAAAGAMLDSGNPQSLNVSHAYLTIGTPAGIGANVVELSDILVSPSSPGSSATNSLNVLLGGGDDYLYFYDNTSDGAVADLNGGGGNNTLDEHRGGNSGPNLTVVNFQTVIPDEMP